MSDLAMGMNIQLTRLEIWNGVFLSACVRSYICSDTDVADVLVMKKYKGSGYVLESLSTESIVRVADCFLKDPVTVPDQDRLDVCAQHGVQAFEKRVAATLDVCSISD